MEEDTGVLESFKKLEECIKELPSSLVYYENWKSVFDERQLVKILRSEGVLQTKELKSKRVELNHVKTKYYDGKSVPNSFFNKKNILAQIKVANSAFIQIERSDRKPNGYLYYVDGYFIYLTKNDNMITLNHIWYSVYLDFIGAYRFSGNAFDILYTLVKDVEILEIDGLEEGSFIMFKRENVNVYYDPEFIKIAEKSGTGKYYVRVKDMIRNEVSQTTKVIVF